MEITNFKKKEMKLLTNEQQKSYENAKTCYICKEKIEEKCAKNKPYCIIRDRSQYIGEYGGAAPSICNLNYSAPKEIPIVFHNVKDNLLV